jgi:hypothetical protein
VTVEVPRIVTVDRCPVRAVPLPDYLPEREIEQCEQALGKGAVCYDRANAWRLAAMLTALAETWRAAKECEVTQ